MKPAVIFDHVWKKFRRGERHDSLRDLIPALARGVVRAKRKSELSNEDEFWALRDVAFEVLPGDALGIIGPNGAGKSTTLKLLTKILRPTRGACVVRGRVGALIEVAAGFHPDLTGRENVFLQGAIMGMARSEIAQKLDAIVEFAGVEKFIDTQVKRYSSGMNARLGFSIAAHLDPDVLIIDEVLSVGDIQFQQKCLARMQEFRREGVTVVFVSHNLQAVSSLCSHALLIRGATEAFGSPDDVIAKYIETSTESSTATTEKVAISSTGIESTSSQQEAVLRPGMPCKVAVTYLSSELVSNFEFGFIIHRTTDGLLVYSRAIDARAIGLSALQPGQPVSVQFEFRTHLTRGHYFLECHVYDRHEQRFLGSLKPAALFRIDEQDSWGGVADLELRCQVADTTRAAMPGSSRRMSS